MPFAPKMIVAATDGSERAINAAGVAADIARTYGAKLHIITVVRPPEGWWGLGGAPPPPEVLAEAVVDAQREVLQRTVEAIDLEGVEYETVEELGDPVATIVGHCEEVGADLLAIGRRGAGLIERFVMGSVADRLARYAPCPVLIVP